MKSFSFMRYRLFFFAISLFFLVPGLFSLIVFKIRPSIDFTGGSLLEVSYTQQLESVQPERQQLQELIGNEPEIMSVQASGVQQAILRTRTITNQEKEEVLTKLRAQYPQIQQLRFETVGPVLGRELLQKTLVAIVIVSIGITLYVWKQFRSLKYGVSAVLAMFHDTFILLGAFSVLGKFFGAEVDVLFVTALLTTLSFSIHDTIVVFDRIRENQRRHPRTELLTVIDASILETLSRSINNSMTIIIMLLSLVLLGGDTIRWFAVALLIGAVTGTYSSTFTAAPLLLLIEDIMKKMYSANKK
jgi:preprotein translocase subunit SecF